MYVSKTSIATKLHRNTDLHEKLKDTYIPGAPRDSSDQERVTMLSGKRGDVKHSTSSRDRQIFGKLGSVSFNDIIQLLGMSKRTATLELRRGEERGHVYFRDGQIIHATAGRYEGEESFIELLGWGDADFSVEEGIETLPKISITKTTEALLLSTMTALDEVGRITERPPIRVAPQSAKPTRRLPPRPKPRARSKTKLAVVLVGVGSAFAASLVALALNPSLWKASSMGAPWDGLPIVNSPRRPQSTLGVPDAWSVAHAAWERPTPIPAVTTTTTTIAMTAALEPAYLTVVVEPWARVDVDGSASPPPEPGARSGERARARVP